ncbi:hypothetical protein AKG07_08810 [Microbacterium sp. CGR1]|nr:hypothetical protein AKG07_08810 [Microbacterium sp. CGR1]
MTEEQWNDETASEIVDIAIDPLTRKPMFVAIFDTQGRIAQELDKNLARVVAVRLVELAQQLPDPPRILRRSTEVDDQLRGLEP